MQAKILQLLVKKSERKQEPVKEIEVYEWNERKTVEQCLSTNIKDVVEELRLKINATKNFGLPLHRQKEIKDAMCYLKEKVDELEQYIKNN